MYFFEEWSQRRRIGLVITRWKPIPAKFVTVAIKNRGRRDSTRVINQLPDPNITGNSLAPPRCFRNNSTVFSSAQCCFPSICARAACQPNDHNHHSSLLVCSLLYRNSRSIKNKEFRIFHNRWFSEEIVLLQSVEEKFSYFSILFSNISPSKYFRDPEYVETSMINRKVNLFGNNSLVTKEYDYVHT